MRIDGQAWRTLWLDGGTLHLIDQTVLPHTFRVVQTTTVEQTAQAIETMIVRGAGAIGATAAAGVAQAAWTAPDQDFHAHVAAGAERIRRTRPTAQNLFVGVEFVLRAIESAPHVRAARDAAIAAAVAFADDDAACCAAIGRHGAPLILDGMGVSTHCNAGWLAFVDWGSALSPIYAAHREGRRVHVWVDETRPRQQGAKLTAFELGQEGIDHSVIADGSIGWWMRQGRVQITFVGADRIAANGDVANKVGTYMVALAAKAAGIPFYVAAPTTTLDTDCPSGDAIPIEERDGDEVAWTWGWSDDGQFLRVRTTPHTSPARNVAFDVTPAHLIAGILTERGLVPATPDGVASVARPKARA